jgi:hypothetical protein
MDDKALKAMAVRLERLEKAVFGAGEPSRSDRRPQRFKGAMGGTRLLISKGFLKQARTASAVKAELDRNGYVYRIQVVQTGLNRLSSRSGPLSAFRKDGKKMYVERK